MEDLAGKQGDPSKKAIEDGDPFRLDVCHLRPHEYPTSFSQQSFKLPQELYLYASTDCKYAIAQGFELSY